MEIYTTSQARANLFKILDYTNSSHDPVYIVGKNNKSVVIAEEDYRAMVETLYICSIPNLKESILKASSDPIEDFSEDIDWNDL